MSLGDWLKRRFGGETCVRALAPEPNPARIPDWADTYYLAKFRESGRREPERRRVVTVTPEAAASIRSSVTERGPWYVRVRVEVFRDAGGMPTAFQNRVDVVTDVYPEFDFLDDPHGILVLVDRRSAVYLAKVTLDWVTTADGVSGLSLR